MSQQANSSKEFYIGWQEKAPASYARSSRRFVWTVAGLLAIVALLFVFGQKGFADSTFELGKITEVEGILVKSPVPMLKIQQGFGDQAGAQSVLLIGFGKHGAEKDIAAIEEVQDIDLDGQSVKLRGTRIYHDGKAALELTEGIKAFVGFGKQQVSSSPIRQSYGEVRLLGEILDPKCALGVMKPGYGKPHRSCAVRCISGGIPPVLRVSDPEGNKKYVLVVGSDGEKINEHLLPFVADQIRICGHLEKIDDWFVLRTPGAANIVRLKPHWLEGDIPMCVN